MLVTLLALQAVTRDDEPCRIGFPVLPELDALFPTGRLTCFTPRLSTPVIALIDNMLPQEKRLRRFRLTVDIDSDLKRPGDEEQLRDVRRITVNYSLCGYLMEIVEGMFQDVLPASIDGGKSQARKSQARKSLVEIFCRDSQLINRFWDKGSPFTNLDIVSWRRDLELNGNFFQGIVFNTLRDVSCITKIECQSQPGLDTGKVEFGVN